MSDKQRDQDLIARGRELAPVDTPPDRIWLHPWIETETCSTEPREGYIEYARAPSSVKVDAEDKSSGEGCKEPFSPASTESNPATPPLAQWQDIETAPKNRNVLAGYFNPLGKWRTIKACYYTEGQLESDTDDSGFAPEGWYEATEAYEYLMPVEHEPELWMPLPPAPGEPKNQEDKNSSNTKH